MSFAACQHLLEKHTPVRAQLPAAREIRLAVAKTHIGRRCRLPDYVVKTIHAEWKERGNLRDVGEIFGVNHSTLARTLKHRGYNLQTKGVRQQVIYKGLSYRFDGRYYVHQLSKSKAQMLHRVQWEERHGPIPKGLFLSFRTPNYSDISDDNLILLTRREQLARALKARYSRSR